MSSTVNNTAYLAENDYYYSPSVYTPTGFVTSPAQGAGPGIASATAKKKTSLASINAPSFSAFRSQVPSAITRLPTSSASQQRSPRAASFSFSESASPRLADPTWRPSSVDSPLPTPGVPASHVSAVTPLHAEEDESSEVKDRRRSLHTVRIGLPHERSDSLDSRIASSVSGSAYNNREAPREPQHAKHAHERAISHVHSHSFSSIDSNEQQFSPSELGDRTSMTSTQQAPAMTLHIDGVQRRLTDEELEAYSQVSQGSLTKTPKSPSNGGISRFFGWNNGQNLEGTSPTTTFSDRSLSPLPSPNLAKTLPVDMSDRRVSPRLTPPGLDIQKANSGHTYFDNPSTPLLLGDDNTNAHVRELERELSQISSELANSIRREMELEDELDRIRGDIPMFPPEQLGHRRGSDYFSDSGASSTKFPITDIDAKLESMDKQVRRVEQEKANIKMEMASKLQTELSRRRDLEELVRDLEDQIEKTSRGSNTEGKLEQLESSLDEARRRLGQEKLTKENFEDLYNATKEELERFRNEAENLRNEVVPQLKARVEGLEAEASDTQAIIYENTRLQQQLNQLKESNNNNNRFNSIAEEGVANAGRMSLQRSGSLARSSSLRRGNSVNVKDRAEGGRQRSGSISVAYADGVKEIEDQRDALHKALRLLIKRHEKQQKEHERAIKKLTRAKDKAETVTPQRTVYTREVAFLKEEVSTLRKRTEDALEQKWQYEKNLSGLKMDLDRAEQETRGLRIMMQDRDDLSHSSQFGDEEDEQLKLSISRAETERDHARQVADEYRQRARESNNGASTELLAAADRMDELAEELEAQVQTNSKLRERLSMAVARGEREQKESTRQIEDMQKRLAGMEDSVLAAQQHSETTLANHDAEVKRIEDATSPHLQRLRISIPDPSKLAPTSPLLRKSPKLGSKKLSETSLLEMSRTQLLERKVRELEVLLKEAEDDMQHVVVRVNKSQMEVADLQTERDAALVQMRKLQAQIVQERENVEKLMQQ